MNLTLVSRSPRRQELLKLAGFDFQIKSKDVTENFPSDMPLEEVPLFLAEKKAMALQHELVENEILISADTVVILENQILNKPMNISEAKAMLRQLSGNQHLVVTGVCILNASKKILFSDKTEVQFRTLSEKEINFYVEKYQPLDKAGAYGVQEFIGMIGIKGIKGCFYNVMGLPVSLLYQKMKAEFSEVFDTQIFSKV